MARLAFESASLRWKWDGASATEESVLDPLDRLQSLSGRYRIERELGRGSMATVYLAEDLKHGRRVALKVLRPELSPALGADRFLREIEIASRPAFTQALASPHRGGASRVIARGRHAAWRQRLLMAVPALDDKEPAS